MESTDNNQNSQTSKKKVSKIPILTNTPQQSRPKYTELSQMRKSIMIPFIKQEYPIETPQKPAKKVFDDRIRSPPTMFPFGVNLFECSPELRKATIAKIEAHRRDPLNFKP